MGTHNRVLDHFRREKASRQVNESESGYDVIGTMRFSEPATEDELVHGEMEQTMLSASLSEPSLMSLKSLLSPCARHGYTFIYPHRVRGVQGLDESTRNIAGILLYTHKHVGTNIG